MGSSGEKKPFMSIASIVSEPDPFLVAQFHSDSTGYIGKVIATEIYILRTDCVRVQL